MMKLKIDVSEMYRFCNRHKLFTCGSTAQYDKMFDIASEGVTQMEIAYILYLCSEYRLDVIYGWLGEFFKTEEEK